MLEIRAEKEGNVKFTRPFCYICKEVTGLYLSLSASKDLDGVLPWNKGCSPTGVNGIRHAEEDRDDEEGQDKVVMYDAQKVEELCGAKLVKCGCPVRSKPPPLPEMMPEGRWTSCSIGCWTGTGLLHSMCVRIRS